VHVGQAEVAAGVAAGEPLVVEAQAGAQGRLHVVDVHRVLDDLEAGVVGGSQAVSRTHSAVPWARLLPYARPLRFRHRRSAARPIAGSSSQRSGRIPERAQRQ